MSRRRRRSHEESDSLELMLDPICNIFGTIMFVALIAALIALMRAGATVAEAVSVAERRQQDGDARLESRVAELERTLATLPAAGGAELDAAATDRVERALGEIARREALVERYRETVDKARADMGQIAAQVQPMQAEVDRVRDALESARRTKDRQVRTPIEREVALFEFTVILWEDRLYAVCDLSSRASDACEWLRAWNNKHVVASRCTTPIFECSRVSIHISRSIVLRAGAGIPVTDIDSLRANPEFRALLASLNPKEDLVGIVVAPDSFDSFAILKDALLSAGLSYSLEPCEQPLPKYEDSWIPGHPRGL